MASGWDTDGGVLAPSCQRRRVSGWDATRCSYGEVHVGDGAINKMAMMKKGDKCPVPRKAGYPAGSTRSQTTAWVHVHARYNSTMLVCTGGLDRLAPAGSTRSQTTAWVHRAPPAFSVGIGTARAPSGLTSPTVTCHRYYPLCLHFSLRCCSLEGGQACPFLTLPGVASRLPSEAA